MSCDVLNLNPTDASNSDDTVEFAAGFDGTYFTYTVPPGRATCVLHAGVQVSAHGSGGVDLTTPSGARLTITSVANGVIVIEGFIGGTYPTYAEDIRTEMDISLAAGDTVDWYQATGAFELTTVLHMRMWIGMTEHDAV